MMNRSWHVAHQILFGTYAGIMMNRKVHWNAQLPEEPVIFTGNHPTTTDPFFIPLLSKRPVTILVTQKAFDIPWFGKVLRAAGHICVQEINPDGKKLIDDAVEKLKEGRSVCIFPEGELSVELNKMAPSHTGVARIALASGAPVVPFGISMVEEGYSKTITDTDNFYSEGRWAVRGPYYTTVGEAKHYYGDHEDRALVREVLHKIVEDIKDVAYQSEERLQREQPLWQPLYKLVMNQWIW
jgi:1-acyl-sn-glycerol-3-phosphate acyltransferase